MSGRVFSVILLPTSGCNVACDYCFEHKEPHQLSPALLPLLTRRLLDHIQNEGIAECEIYWQGGEAMLMGPDWFANADHFIGRPARLPCIWKENCSNQFISVDAKGSVAQCDSWVTSYPEYFFGNIFREPDLSRMLKTSGARRDFVERPKHLVENEDCLSCRYLSICHGGCPVRTYSARGTIMTKDPYCEVYKVVFARAEKHGQRFT